MEEAVLAAPLVRQLGKNVWWQAAYDGDHWAFDDGRGRLGLAIDPDRRSVPQAEPRLSISAKAAAVGIHRPGPTGELVPRDHDPARVLCEEHR